MSLALCTLAVRQDGIIASDRRILAEVVGAVGYQDWLRIGEELSEEVSGRHDGNGCVVPRAKGRSVDGIR